MAASVLLVDVGNTRTKYALAQKPFIYLSFDEVMGLSKGSKVVFCKTGHWEQKEKEFLEDLALEWKGISKDTQLPFVSLYNRETIGQDRIAALLGAFALSGGEDFIVFDVGTCLTVDIFTDGVHQGGYISPGLVMRLKAMHQFTAALPDANLGWDKEHLLFEIFPETTLEALRMGALSGLVYEIEGHFPGIKKRFLTGGDSEKLLPFLEKEYEHQPDLVMEGLLYLSGFGD